MEKTAWAGVTGAHTEAESTPPTPEERQQGKTEKVDDNELCVIEYFYDYLAAGKFYDLQHFIWNRVRNV